MQEIKEGATGKHWNMSLYFLGVVALISFLG